MHSTPTPWVLTIGVVVTEGRHWQSYDASCNCCEGDNESRVHFSIVKLRVRIENMRTNDKCNIKKKQSMMDSHLRVQPVKNVTISEGRTIG